jgi:hypothetical protein
VDARPRAPALSPGGGALWPRCRRRVVEVLSCSAGCCLTVLMEGEHGS